MRTTILTVLCALIVIASLSSCDRNATEKARILENKLAYTDSLLNITKEADFDRNIFDFAEEQSKGSKREQVAIYRAVKEYCGNSYRVEYKGITRSSF